MLDVPDRPASRGWYLVSFGLIGIALAIGLTGWTQMREVVVNMQRQLMAGSREIALAGGRATIYYEHSSTFENKDYATPPEMTFSCTLKNLNGKPHVMTAPTVTNTYTSGPYAGRSIYEIDVMAPGNYTLTCDGAEPYVVAIGGGLGAWFVVAIVGASMPGLAGILVLVILTLKRRRWFARQARDA